MNVVEPLDLRKAIWTFFEQNRAVVLANVMVKPGPRQEEAVHELRVATKKIRAVYRLCQAIDGDGFVAKKEMKALRVLFRTAGTLREIQVHKSVLEAYEELHLVNYRKLHQRLNLERKDAIPYYEVQRKQFDKKHLVSLGNKIALLLTKTSEQTVCAVAMAFARARVDEMQAAMPLGYEPELIHKSRIFLKEAMYLVSLLQTAGYLKDPDRAWTVAAKQAAEIAGDWHDREIFAHWLHSELRLRLEKDYALLVQDLYVNTRALVKRFRQMLVPLTAFAASESETR